MVKLRQVFLLCVIIIFVGGCDSGVGDLFGDKDDSPADTPQDSTDTSPVKTIIGRGYDVFGVYADPTVMQAQVLDFNRLSADGMIEKTPIGRTIINKTSGTSTSDYQKKLGVTAGLSGKYKYFSGSVKTSFNMDVAELSSYEFCTISASVRDSKYSIKDVSDIRVLKKYMSAQFTADLVDTSIKPEKLFSIYGTHVLVGVILGGRFDYNLAAKRESTNKSTSIEVFAEVKYKTKFASAAANGEFKKDETEATGFSSEKITTSLIGNNTCNLSEGDKAYLDWIQGLTADTIQFCDFSDTNSLVGIWEFCDDTERKDEIIAALTAWEEDKNDWQNDADPTSQKLAEIYDGNDQSGTEQYGIFGAGTIQILDLASLCSESGKYKICDLITDNQITTPINFNDRINSIWVADGYVLTVYRDSIWRGELYQFVGGNGSLPDKAKNLGSSISIEACNSMEPIAILYQHADYQGNEKKYYTEVKETKLEIYDDMFSSVKILDNTYKLVIYTDPDFSGNRNEYTADTALFSKEFNDLASSIQIVKK